MEKKNPWVIGSNPPQKRQEDYGAYADVILPEKIMVDKQYFHLKRRQFELDGKLYYEMAYADKNNNLPTFRYNGGFYAFKTSGTDKDLVIAKMKKLISYYKEYLKNKGKKVFD